MGFIDDRLSEFWARFTQNLSDRQRTARLVILLGALAVIFILGGKFSKSQILAVIILVLGSAWYWVWLKSKKIGLIVLVLLVVGCTSATWLYFTATQRRAKDLIAKAQELKRQGQYEASLNVLGDAKNLLAKSIKDRTAGPEATLCLAEMGEVEIMTGKWQQAETHLNEGLSLSSSTELCGAQPALSLWLGELARLHGDPILAKQYFGPALEHYRKCNDAKGRADALVGLGKAASIGRMPDYPEALESFRQADQVYTTLGDKLGHADVLASQGDIQHNQGDYGEALSSYLNSQGIYRDEKYLPGQVDTLLKMGDLYSDQAYWNAARNQYEEASRIAGRIHSLWRESLSEDSLGDIEQNWGSSDVAIRHYEQAKTDAEKISWQFGLVTVLIGKGYAEIHQGSFGAANTDLAAARDGYHALGISKGEAEAQIAIGELTLESREFEKARGNFGEALNLLRNNRENPLLEEELQARSLRGLADAERSKQLYPEADGHYKEALTLYNKHGNRQGEASVLTGQGRLEEAWHHDAKKASDLYERAMTIFQDKKIDDRRGQAGVCSAQGDLLSRLDPGRACEKYLSAWNSYRNLGDKARADQLEPLTKCGPPAA